MKISVDQIVPNPEQPRVDFDDTAIQSMADSILKHGLLNPIAVYQDGDHYVLIDGERRWRAFKLAGLGDIEANILPKNGNNPDSMLEMAMLGNVQRKNMNPVEEGLAYAKMIQRGKTSKEVSEIFGISNQWARTLVAITELEPEIQELYILKRLPILLQVVIAIKNLPDSDRITIASGFALRKTGINGILNTCKRIIKNNGRGGMNQAPSRNLETGPDWQEPDTPAFKISRKKERAVIDLDHWDALRQAGHVPTWELFTTNVQKTCKRCALYDAASFTNCRDCPLVDLIGLLKQEKPA